MECLNIEYSEFLLDSRAVNGYTPVKTLVDDLERVP
jgi:hypothetical protein